MQRLDFEALIPGYSAMSAPQVRGLMAACSTLQPLQHGGWWLPHLCCCPNLPWRETRCLTRCRRLERSPLPCRVMQRLKAKMQYLLERSEAKDKRQQQGGPPACLGCGMCRRTWGAVAWNDCIAWRSMPDS